MLQRTSDAIKAVQSQFAVKHELATQADSGYVCIRRSNCQTINVNINSVIILCAQLESTFLHGLKAPKKKRGELGGCAYTANILFTYFLAYWPFLKEILSPGQVQPIMQLQHITTDSGRGMECRLLRYMIILMPQAARGSDQHSTTARSRPSFAPLQATGTEPRMLLMSLYECSY